MRLRDLLGFKVKGSGFTVPPNLALNFSCMESRGSGFFVGRVNLQGCVKLHNVQGLFSVRVRV